MRNAALSNRQRGPVAFWALAGVALLISHDAVFTVQLGPGESLVRALRDAGHQYWGAASAVLAAIGLVAGVATALHLRRLRHRAARLDAAQPGAVRVEGFGRPWLRLFAVVALAFLLQENAEHFIRHGHLIGTGALIGPEYPLALPVIAAMTLVAALIAALLRGAETMLVSTILAALSRLARRPRRIAGRAPLHVRARRIPMLARSKAERAPPVMLRA